MPREIVRDRSGRVLGWYQSNAISGKIDARDSAGRWLGYCDKKLNETRDEAGRPLARGDVLPSLIFRP